MTKYTIEITRAVENDLAELKHLRSKAVEKLLQLEEKPFQKTSSLSGNLKGLRSFRFNLAEGAYRAVIKIYEDDRVCLLIIVGSRENLYKKAARRVKALKKQGLI